MAPRAAGASEATAMFLFASPPLAYDRRDRPAQEALLRSAYAGEGWRVPHLLAGLGAAPELYFDPLSQVHMGQWSRGRVVLLGDAAYCASPASGQGTSLTLVGAYVLAEELATADGPGAAFAAYQRRMRPFVSRNQKLGPANVKRMVLRTPGQVRMSMRMLGLLNRLPGKERLMARAVAPIHAAANAISLERSEA
jgi:2-polyprenyl-6-methoxyphenol hydroxylase-like FAD-dependent oxidoreductase